MKTLYFEGAGCVPCGEVENCRIRTAFHLDDGRAVYLEIIGYDVDKHSADRVKLYAPVAAFVWSCFEIQTDDGCEDENKHTITRGNVFRYTKSDILRFVNSLGASFEKIEVLNDGYRVFAGSGKYNFGDEI